MRTRTVLSTALAAGLMATALIATPALAAGGSGAGDGTGCADGTSTSTMMGSATGAVGMRGGGAGSGGGADAGSGSGSGSGSGGGFGSGGMGAGSGTASALTAESGTVTEAQEAILAAMAEEEKLAHDLYLAFADSYDVRVFSRVAGAETRHLAAVQALLVDYGIDDPTAGQAVGEFATDATQDLYDELLAQGAASLDGAYEAARTVESTDIADLQAATEGVTAPDVLAVYEHLLAGSERHLVAFGG